MGIKSRGKAGVAEEEEGGNDLDGEEEVGGGGEEDESGGWPSLSGWIPFCVWHGTGGALREDWVYSSFLGRRGEGVWEGRLPSRDICFLKGLAWYVGLLS